MGKHEPVGVSLQPSQFTTESTQSVPETALNDMTREIKEAGGEWTGNLEDEGALGWTAFDTSTSNDGTVAVLLPKETILDLPHQSLVRIHSRHDKRSYMGVVVAGPFAEPDGLRSDAPIVVTATVRGKGNIFISKYHGRVQVELIGEELADGTVIPPRRRPLPNSPVFVLSTKETGQFLHAKGDIRLGLLVGHEDIEVRIPSDRKSVLPRHVGILGTTGSGKSTTVSGFIAQLQKVGVACIIIDTEGEYTALNEPTEDAFMEKALAQRHLKKGGVENTHVYHLVGRETANPDHPALRKFSLRFSELSPYAVMEILELTDAQQERFLKAYDATKLILERLKIFPSNDNERKEQMNIDEMETGFPRMTIGHIYDVIRIIAAKIGKEQDPPIETKNFDERKEEIKQIVAQLELPANVISWRALLGRVGRVKRLGIFDTKGVDAPNYTNMLQRGQVSIIDLSDTDSPQVNNLVIAQILRGIQRQQDTNYREATESGKLPTPAMVFIEEAHEFLSAERIKHMPVLFQQVARIARRGRKRWLGLVFITQLPQHVPDEVLGLINNWVIHKVSDANVVNRLQRSIGNIEKSLWARLPTLAPGQATVSFTSLARPLLVAIDPTPSKLLMVE